MLEKEISFIKGGFLDTKFIKVYILRLTKVDIFKREIPLNRLKSVAGLSFISRYLKEENNKYPLLTDNNGKKKLNFDEKGRFYKGNTTSKGKRERTQTDKLTATF